MSTPLDKREVVEFDPEEHTLWKCLPKHLPRRPNDVYVNMKSSFKQQLTRCRLLLQEGGNREVVIHGLGAAVSRAVNMALLLQADDPQMWQLSVNTSTVMLTDYLVPKTDEAQEEALHRYNSSVHIRLSEANCVLAQ